MEVHFKIPFYAKAALISICIALCLFFMLVRSNLWRISYIFPSFPLTAIIKVTFDYIKSLKPWGFLLGNNVPAAFKHSLK